MLEVACVKWGTKYSADYVNRLARAVVRNMQIPFKFVCYTDDPEGLWCLHAPIPGTIKVEGWWNKLTLFGLRKEVLLIDLDCVIVGDLSPFVHSDALAIKDPWQWGFNSSVVRIPANMGYVYDDFLVTRPDMRGMHGDQDWLNVTPGFSPGRCFEEGWCASYKAEVKGKRVPEDCRVVYFHGEPKPHQVKEQFVIDNWR